MGKEIVLGRHTRCQWGRSSGASYGRVGCPGCSTRRYRIRGRGRRSRLINDCAVVIQFWNRLKLNSTIPRVSKLCDLCAWGDACSDDKVFPCHDAHHEWCRAQWSSRKFRQHCTLRSAWISASCTRESLRRTRQAAVNGRRIPVARRHRQERDGFLPGAQNSLSWHLVGDGAGGSGGGGGIGGGGGTPAGQK